MFLDTIVPLMREWRSRHLNYLGKFLVKLRIKANYISVTSFICGLVAFYYLFSNYWLFVIFGLLNLILDGLDGVVAGLSKPTKLGKYLDSFFDGAFSFLLMLKVYFYLKEYYVLIILVMMVSTYFIWFLSKLKSPVMFVRTGSVFVLIFAPLFELEMILTLGYLVVGIFMLVSLMRQLNYFLRRNMI